MRHGNDLREAFPQDFGSRMKYVKKRDKITWQELSDRTGLSINALCLIGAGKRGASLYTAVAIARALDVSLDWLSGLVD